MFTGEFKGISGATLKEFQTFTSSEMGLKEYICIPVYQFGKLKFIEVDMRVWFRPNQNTTEDRRALL